MKIKSLFSFSWLELRTLGNSKLVQATVLVPVLGYLILFSEWFLELLGDENGFNLLWKVYCLYYSFTFIALASVLYSFRCPFVFKHYGSLADYVEKEERLYGKYNIGKLLQRIVQTLYRRGIETTEDASEHVKSSLDQLFRIHPTDDETYKVATTKIGREIIDNEKLIEYLSFFYNHHHHLNLKSKNFVIFLYIVGFILLAIPSLAMFIEVVVKTATHLLNEGGLYGGQPKT